MATEIRENATERGLAVFREMREVLSAFPTDRFIQLLPTSAQEMSDLYRPAVTVVKIDPADGRDVYDTPGSGGKTVCLHSQALERIANAAGIDFDPTLTRHVHDRVQQPFICEIHVGGWYTDSLGQRRPITAGAVSDLRDGTPTAKVLRGGLETARQFICERTESRARNRAIRKTTNLPSSFSRDELKKPMVAVRFRLDERDPEARRALIAQGTRATTEVFGTSGPAIDAGVARPEEEIIEGQVTEQPAPAAAAAPKVDDEPDIVEPPTFDPHAVTSAVEKIRASLKYTAQQRAEKAADAQLGKLGLTTAEVLGLKGKASQAAMKSARLAIARALFGPAIASARDLAKDQAEAWGKWLDYAEGHQQLRDLFAWLLLNDASLEGVRAELGDAQQTLGVAS